MAESFSGEGPFTITAHDGHVVLIEIWSEGTRMTFGTPAFDGKCPRCGQPLKVYTPGNTTQEMCDPCTIAVAEEMGL